MTSRAVILPFPGDPFLLNYWLSLFDKYWGEEIDKLYIYFNSTIEQGMVDYIQSLCASRPTIQLIYNPVQIEHGDAINKTLDLVTEDYVMLIEDDAFIFRSGMIDWCFTQVEEGGYDIVGSKRNSCSTEILKKAKQVFGIPYDGEGDQGPNFWPSFFFCKKDLLLKTNRYFGAKAWKKGEVIEVLDNHVVEDDVIASDTFVWASLQLHALVPERKILYVPQYHGHPDDLDHFITHYRHSMFGGEAPWCHIGSLSSGVGGLLRDGNNRPLARRTVDQPEPKTVMPPQWCQSDFEKREFERRVQWWLTFYEYAKPNEQIAEFYDLYGKACQQIIQQYKLDAHVIRQRQKIYKTLGL